MYGAKMFEYSGALRRVRLRPQKGTLLAVGRGTANRKLLVDCRLASASMWYSSCQSGSVVGRRVGAVFLRRLR
jgi:hypothetical protein